MHPKVEHPLVHEPMKSGPSRGHKTLFHRCSEFGNPVILVSKLVVSSALVIYDQEEYGRG